MEAVWFGAGVLLLLGVGIDALWTTLWVDGHGGPWTRRHTTAVWWAMRRVAGRNHRALSLTGPVVLVLTVLNWAVLLWAGWVLLFSADPAALVDPHTGARATLVDRVYFTGYTMFTLGNGDFAPRGDVWKLATSAASLSGLFFLTLSVTYLLAVLEAVVAKRSFAGQVRALARTPEEFVTRAWDGAGFPSADLLLLSLTEQLNHVTEQHTAYPLLHCYHEANLEQSVPLALAVFDDALTLFEGAVSPGLRPAPGVLRTARGTVSTFLRTLQSAYVQTAEHPPPPPRLAALAAAGIPTAGEGELTTHLAGLQDHRKLVLGFVNSEARDWPGNRDLD